MYMFILPLFFVTLAEAVTGTKSGELKLWNYRTGRTLRQLSGFTASKPNNDSFVAHQVMTMTTKTMTMPAIHRNGPMIQTYRQAGCIGTGGVNRDTHHLVLAKAFFFYNMT